MLVLSRKCNESILIKGSDGGGLLTVSQISEAEVTLVIGHAPVSGEFDAWTADLALGATLNVGSTALVALLEVRGDKARIGIETSVKSHTFRFEVYDAIKKERHPPPSDGSTGIPVPRPGDPKPPTRDARLNEPPTDEDDEM